MIFDLYDRKMYQNACMKADSLTLAARGITTLTSDRFGEPRVWYSVLKSDQTWLLRERNSVVKPFEMVKICAECSVSLLEVSRNYNLGSLTLNVTSQINEVSVLTSGYEARED